MIHLLALLILLGCEAGTVEPPAPKQKHVTLTLYVAPPCIPCEHELRGLKNLPDLYSDDELSVKVLVETGRGWANPPTDEISTLYCEMLGVPFDCQPDTDGSPRPTWPAFSVFFKQKSLPAAIIQDDEGKVLRRFGSDAGGYTYQTILSALRSLL